MAVIITNSVSDPTQSIRINTLDNAGIFEILDMPSGVQILPRRPNFLQYKKQLLILGHYTSNLIIDQFFQIHKVGIIPPTIAPTLAATTGSITATSVFGYTTYLQKRGSAIVAESNPSPPSNVISLAAQGRAWTNIPTTAPDSRVTHVRGYVSVDGSDARMAWERQLGVSTVSETLDILVLGDVVNFNRGVPRPAVFGEVYHDRVWYVDADDRSRVWFSEQFEPESVGATSFFTLWDGEYITGLKRSGDTLLIFGRNVCYALTGWEEEDFQLRKISPSVGCISHFSLVDINGRTWFASQDGVYVYDGVFRPMMKDLASYWRDDYLAHLNNYENAIAFDDRYYNTYKLLIPQDDISLSFPNAPLSFYYVGSYRGVEPELSGTTDQPKWSFDIRHRRDYTLGGIRSNQSNREELYTGSFDGRVRKENSNLDPDDLGDSYHKQFLLQTPFYVFEDPGGDLREGKNLKQSWAYVEGPLAGWNQKFYGGDEWCGDGTNPAFIKHWGIPTVEPPVVVTPSGTDLFTYVYQIVPYGPGNLPGNLNTGSTNIGPDPSVLSSFPINISWPAATGATFYKVYRYLGGTTQGLIGTTTDTQFSDNGLVGDGNSASAPITDSTHLRRTVWFCVPEHVTGRGIVETFVANAPTDFVFRGLGGIYDIGTAFRGAL